MKRIINRLHIIVMLLIAGLLATACGKDEPAAPAHRTVLVYMVAGNSLGDADRDDADLAEMRRCIADGGLNGARLVIYHSSRAGSPRLYELTAAGEKELATYPANSGVLSVSPERMRAVIADTRALAPADELGLVLWSHGTGWVEDSGTLKSWGDDSGNKMSIPSLGAALDGQNLAFIYFDCCLMATAEVAYELRGATGHIIASGTELPADGMPYHLTLPYLTRRGSADVTGAAAATFGYYDAMNGFSRSCTMTVINTAGMARLAEATRTIMASAPASAINLDRQQPYDMAANCSLWDMKLYINSLDTPQALLDEWNAAYADVIEYAAATPSLFGVISLDHYSGLGCQILLSSTDALWRGYTNLAWWRDVISHNPNFNIK